MYLSMTEFDHEIKRLCPEVKETFRIVSGKRIPCYKFPSLKRCRELFEQAVGMRIDWEENK